MVSSSLGTGRTIEDSNYPYKTANYRFGKEGKFIFICVISLLLIILIGHFAGETGVGNVGNFFQYLTTIIAGWAWGDGPQNLIRVELIHNEN